MKNFSFFERGYAFWHFQVGLAWLMWPYLSSWKQGFRPHAGVLVRPPVEPEQGRDG